jgi:hypothetical protein
MMMNLFLLIDVTRPSWSEAKAHLVLLNLATRLQLFAEVMTPPKNRLRKSNFHTLHFCAHFSVNSGPIDIDLGGFRRQEAGLSIYTIQDRQLPRIRYFQIHPLCLNPSINSSVFGQLQILLDGSGVILTGLYRHRDSRFHFLVSHPNSHGSMNS